MSKKWDEEIIVVERAAVFRFEDEVFQGVETDKEKVKTLMSRIDKGYEIRRRGNTNDPTPLVNNMEINPAYKQPIPYVVIRRGNEVYSYKRLTGGGEARLHGNISIGFGGHMNRLVGTTFGVELIHNMYRELNEELHFMNIVAAPEANVIGFINDDSNEVGRVHLGVLIEVYLNDSIEVEVKEKDKLEGAWINIKDLQKTPLFENLENWSQLAAKEVKEI